MIRIAFGQIQVHPGEPATNFQCHRLCQGGEHGHPNLPRIVPQWLHGGRLVGPSAFYK